MRGFNKAIIVGNLVRDPEVKYTTTNRAVAYFTVAVNRAWKESNGEIKEETDFIPVVVWGHAAEYCQRNFFKGDGVLVEGRINIRSYETKNGEKRNATEIIASGVQFAGSSQRQQTQSNTTPNYQAQTRQWQSQGQVKNNRYTPQELEDAGAVSRSGRMEIPY